MCRQLEVHPKIGLGSSALCDIFTRNGMVRPEPPVKGNSADLWPVVLRSSPHHRILRVRGERTGMRARSLENGAAAVLLRDLADIQTELRLLFFAYRPFWLGNVPPHLGRSWSP
jgi:hypothetical protein